MKLKLYIVCFLAINFYLLPIGHTQIIISNTSCPTTTPICTTLTNAQVVAPNDIVVQPKTDIKATLGNESRLYIDKTIQLPANYSSSTSLFSNIIPPINYALPVGAIPGSGNVSP